VEVTGNYKGTDKLETSVGNVHEVIPAKKVDWTMGYRFKIFSFINKQDCLVSVNGSDPIFLEALQGFDIDEKFPAIESFIILQPNIQYQFLGIY
jgi:hypothetical protein